MSRKPNLTNVSDRVTSSKAEMRLMDNGKYLYRIAIIIPSGFQFVAYFYSELRDGNTVYARFMQSLKSSEGWIRVFPGVFVEVAEVYEKDRLHLASISDLPVYNL